MNNTTKTVNRIAYLLNKKIIKNIVKDSNKYTVHDMKNDLKEIREFLKLRGFHEESKKIYTVIGRIARLDVYKPEVLDILTEIRNVLDKISEKHRVMNKLELEKNRDYVKYVSRKIKKKENGEAIEKYDVVYIPTQGGFHYSVVYDILDNGTALCFPITTASNRDLRMLGNSSHELSDCGCPMFDGNRLTSATAYVSIKRAAYSKIAHVFNHDEIDTAVARFNMNIQSISY